MKKLKKLTTISEIQSLPVLPMRGFVVFPRVVLHFDISRKKSIAAARKAFKSGEEIFLVAQKSLTDKNPKPEKLYSFGVRAKIKELIKLNKDTVRVLVESLGRAKALEYNDTEGLLEAKIIGIPEEICKHTSEYEALVRTAKDAYAEYLSLIPNIPKELVVLLVSNESAGDLADHIASNMFIDFKIKQALLEETDSVLRLQKMISIIIKETEILRCELKIAKKIKSSMDKHEKEFFLREQKKAIEEELGEDAESTEFEAKNLEKKIKKLNLTKNIEKKLLKECKRLAGQNYFSSEANLVRDYIEECVTLPWNKMSKDELDIENAEKILNKGHFGLTDVKERIVEFLAVRQMAPDVKGQIICLVGPPGVGKSSVVKSVAKAMGRKFVRVSLGGIKDESEIRGHRKTYVGAMPGRIITALKQAETRNPVILLDEIDKLSKDFRGDPSAALLEVLDSEQNKEFRDHYIEVPFDLSEVLFIATANDRSGIAAPLYDRMETIDLYSYTIEEKFNIAKKHLIPKQMKNHALSRKNFKISDKAIYKLAEGYTKEAGVRELERKLASLMRKAAKEILEKNSEKASVNVDEKNLEKMLGPVKFKKEKIEKVSKVGIVNGLAWTSVGGETMPIEVALMKGKGKVQVTGSLGDVMKESAQVAVSYIRSNARNLGISEDFYKKLDIHIHAPEGATPKDGPSAGVTMTTALVSALSEVPVKQDVAMTGEITLKGSVLPIGGLKEKTMAAFKAGIKKVIVPGKNESDLSKIDESVKENLDFVFAENLEEVFENALERTGKPREIYIEDGILPSKIAQTPKIKQQKIEIGLPKSPIKVQEHEF